MSITTYCTNNIEAPVKGLFLWVYRLFYPGVIQALFVCMVGNSVDAITAQPALCLNLVIFAALITKSEFISSISVAY
jgi:hypothetical protein